MIRYENECCGCDAPNYPCRGYSCPLRHVPHLICDRCGDDVEKLFLIHDDLCEDCFMHVLETKYGIETEDGDAVERFIQDMDIETITIEEVLRQ